MNKPKVWYYVDELTILLFVLAGIVLSGIAWRTIMEGIN
jgi:hypothetical protein